MYTVISLQFTQLRITMKNSERHRKKVQKNERKKYVDGCRSKRDRWFGRLLHFHLFPPIDNRQLSIKPIHTFYLD
jgi:hypothetical protein